MLTLLAVVTLTPGREPYKLLVAITLVFVAVSTAPLVRQTKLTNLSVPDQRENQETNQANDHEGQHSLNAKGHERITLSKVQIFRIHSATLFLFCCGS